MSKKKKISLPSLVDLDERILKQQQEEEERKRQRRERKKEKKVGRIDTLNTNVCEAKLERLISLLNFVVLIYILILYFLFE